jgi:hypothetical protein
VVAGRRDEGVVTEGERVLARAVFDRELLGLVEGRRE